MSISGRKEISWVMLFTRTAFVVYFFFALWALKSDKFPHSGLHFVWLVYLVALYFAAEKVYSLFLAQGVDLTFAMPLLFAVYCFSLVTSLLGGQERLPILNRAEHFIVFVLIAFVVWIFFTKYLPQGVWKDHPYYTALLALSVTSLFGVGNEIIELVLDHIFNTNNIGQRFDTPLDLLMNTLGSGLFLSVRLILGEAEHKRITE